MNDWPPDYKEKIKWRFDKLEMFEKEPEQVLFAREYYKTHPVEFIEDWLDTYDPRNAGTEKLTKMPFILFDKQKEFIEYLYKLVISQENGLVEKARDMGATWCCGAFSVWLWLFHDGSSIGWGSRKEQLVDKIGDPDSIFEKIRMLILGIPDVFLPIGFDDRQHMSYMKIINPKNDSTITGESGDNIGRGGRKLIYFKDESAHYERPEKIEASLGDNTNVQVDISSVNGLGNVFHRKREAGVVYTGDIAEGETNVFIMDWRDHPAKTQEWYDKRKKKAENEGLLHIFKQEVDRDYGASIEGSLVPMEWFDAAVDAHIKIGFGDDGGQVSALDVADEGKDKNAYTIRRGLVLNYAESWSIGDVGKTSRYVVGLTTGEVDLQYDCIGLGAGVKSEANRLKEERLLPSGIEFYPWDAGGAVLNPDENIIVGDEETPTNKRFFENLKAQAAWSLRQRFERTYKVIENGEKHNASDLISISSDIPKTIRDEIRKELAQIVTTRSARLRVMIDKAPEGTKSPNLADSVIMNFYPMPRRKKDEDNWTPPPVITSKRAASTYRR